MSVLGLFFCCYIQILQENHSANRAFWQGENTSPLFFEAHAKIILDKWRHLRYTLSQVETVDADEYASDSSHRELPVVGVQQKGSCRMDCGGQAERICK